uniref:RNase H type-1 domain-containing protein n=1 Tax=Aegilops tauschii subsp. strangulata TaxID=200361 RepID=A0A452ZH43_AEGTS
GERAGTAVVARDHEGKFLSGSFSTYTGHTDPYVCEALGCRDALLLAKEKGWERIQLVTACKNVADDWNARRDRSSCGPVFLEMASYLSSFQGFEVRHCGREANKTAHLLAKHCLSTRVLNVTYDVIPDFLSAAVHLDYVRSMNE